jgi:hypothetical protein
MKKKELLGVNKTPEKRPLAQQDNAEKNHYEYVNAARPTIDHHYHTPQPIPPLRDQHKHVLGVCYNY